MTFATKIAAAVLAAAVMLMFCVTASADSPARSLISDGDYIAAVDGAFGRELEKLQSETLCGGFLQSGAAESEADWYMLSARVVGRGEDYAAYAEAAAEILAKRLENPGEYYLTELARTAAVIGICGGDQPDLSALELSSAGDNEVIWTALAQKVGGYDYAAAESELISRQSADGGFGISGSSDADVTAMALNVLPIDSEQAQAALEYLKKYYAENSGELSTETAAQLIIGLCSQGINPSQSADFTTSEGVRPIDILLSRRSDGGFSHFEGGEPNDMSTMQALTSLAALGYYSVKGRSVFDGSFEAADVLDGENLCGETFDGYDSGVLDGIKNVQANDLSTLKMLEDRAVSLGADEKTLSEIEEKLGQSEKICAEIEDLNSEIREKFYPAEEVNLKKLGELHKLNVKISGYSDGDRKLILAADELAKREKKLSARRKNLIILGGAALICAAVLYIIRKKKHE